jgi:uncharacterized phage protein (TIGR02220 family)
MQKSYYAIIPADVRYDKELSPNAKLLYGEITALCNEKGYCWASNAYFSELYEVHNKSISRLISQLEKKGYIKIEMILEGKQVKSRHISIAPSNNNVTTYPQNCYEGINENVTTPSNKNVTENTTVTNTTTNNTKEYIPYSEIVSYLNEKVKANFKSSSTKTIQLIRARWKEGFTLDDFKQVIDIKTDEWISDSKMNRYLRPETLFGTKFESYLNQKGVKNERSKQSTGQSHSSEYDELSL